MKNCLIKFNNLFSYFFFNLLDVLQKLRGVSYFMRNRKRYVFLNKNPSFNFLWKYARPQLRDRFFQSGAVDSHYFLQDLWAAKWLYDRQIHYHVDIGSRLDGFIAHILVFCQVIYMDIRSVSLKIDNCQFRQGSILDMPFEDRSINSLSCLHVLEHIGLGRYGDPINPDGYLRAASELSRVLAPGGTLLMSTPVGLEKLYYDAHRVFNPNTIVAAFSKLHLEEFHLINDSGKNIIYNTTFEEAEACHYGCGLFVFKSLK